MKNAIAYLLVVSPWIAAITYLAAKVNPNFGWLFILPALISVETKD